MTIECYDISCPHHSNHYGLEGPFCDETECIKYKGGSTMNRQFFIAGVQFRPKDVISKALKVMKVDDKLTLIPEPSNKFDPNAVQLVYESFVDMYEEIDVFLGYVPKKFSAEISAMLEVGTELECVINSINPSAKPWEMCEVVIKEVKNDSYKGESL